MPPSTKLPSRLPPTSAADPAPEMLTAPALSQWGLVWQQFRRDRLAVSSALLLLAIFTISVFAPLLANGAPLWYVGFNRFEYQDAHRTLRVLIDQLGKAGAAGSPQVGASSIADRVQAVQVQAATMSRYLPAEKQAALTSLVAEISQLGASSSNADAVSRMRRLLREDFDPRKMEFVSVPHWPVLQSLIWGDIAFMVFNVLLLTIPLWNRLVARVSVIPAVRTRCAWAVLIGIPLVCGAAWWLAVPVRIDRTSYKQGVLANVEPAVAAKAPVVYEQVLWPLVPYALDTDNLNEKFQAPSKLHWMGTDGLGRDTMSRMVWGGRVSLAVGVVSVSIYIAIGIVVGAIAGYFRGIPDLLISRVIEVVICFPSFFLILTIVAFLGPSIFNIMVVIGIIGWTGVARLVRGEFLRLGEQEFILAGRALGFSPFRIIFRHVLPNAIAPVLVTATFGIAGAILTESGLSFLGFGITIPRPSWGGILSSGRDAIFEAPWLIYFPGLAIFLTITCCSLVGETLRDAADPRLRGSR